ncbi:AAA family ATPase [Rhodobacteraceae bacterium]|nr:AAA family ATPase [Paracoccaceae bacterium]
MMRLQRLGLEFFGHFTDKWLDFGDRPDRGSDFHLVYGSNEAGKTTVMEGYLRLLYGFRHIEPYDFKHKRPNLKVSATLMLEDGIREFTRLPGRKNSLVDQSGTAVPETALQGMLSGLAIDDYRKLLCLDDATIEDGGDEIANSKGDIGRLLFSAAAGVSDLSEVLDTVDTRCGDLYKKGGTKSVFSQLKRDLDDVTAHIRETDISVSDYRHRKQALEDTEAFEKGVREERREKLNLQARLEAIAMAFPVSTKIAEMVQELEPLEHFPVALDVDPEQLVELSKQRVLLEAEQNRLKDLIDEKTKARDAIAAQPEMGQIPTRLGDLRDLRNRCGTAATDLPRRQSQRDEVVEDMKRGLTDIGLKPDDVPDRFVFDLTYLRDLEMKYQAVVDAEGELRTADEEERNAFANFEAAKNTLNELPVVTGEVPDLQKILDLQNAPHVLAEANKATEALRLAQQSARATLSLLSLGEQSFETVPEATQSVEEASRLARDVESARDAVIRAQDDLADAEEEAQQLVSRRNALEGSSAFVTDDEASASRSNRDRLWKEHLGDLAQPSAKLFEIAMRDDDAKGVTRHGQAKELAEVRQLNIALAEATDKSVAKKAAIEKTERRLDALQSELQGHLVAAGLKADLSATGFTDWVRKAETARAQAIAAENEKIATAPVFEKAELLRKELAKALDAPTARLEALVPLASKIAAENEKAKIKQQAAQRTKDDAKSEHLKRANKRTDASGTRDETKAAWSKALQDTFDDAGNAIPFPQAFEVFRGIRELNEKVLGLRRQIDGMETDQKALGEALVPVFANDPVLAEMPTIDAYDALVSKSEAAIKSDGIRAELSSEIDTAEGKLQSAQGDLDSVDAQVRNSAAMFDSTIPTGTVEELRKAVLRARQAIELRAEIASLSSDLCSFLNVQSKPDAEELLEKQSLSEVRASITEVERDLSNLEENLTTAIENRTRAKSDLDAITGDADVAMLVTRRQTIELEMESVIRSFLELRIGHLMADEAIRRYRDKHRSGMMEAAEAAFTELTTGAYGGLTTQIEGTNETLVAIQTSDGAAKQAHAMSKGTRFQLYLALRAAAYEQMAANDTVLPFFCDDVFETFDEDRTRAACGLMRRIGLTGQAVYLTHHRHVVEIAKEVCGDEVRIHEI